MNKNKQIFELYIDYLMASFRYTTATGLSNLFDGEICHDQSTRFYLKGSSPLKICGNTYKRRCVKLNLMMVYLFSH